MAISRAIIRSVVDILGGIVLFISLQHLAGDFIAKFNLLFLVGGLLLIIFSKKIREKLKLPEDSIQVVGGIFAFLGIHQYIVQNLNQFVWWFFIGSLLVLVLAEKIVDLVRKF